MILQPGFSTAEELSQVSGRGVGMDVVLTEVKQLGGTLDIGSEPGRGTRFTIRLPFTLAITDSLLVTLGDDIYAVPHSSMDGVVRVPIDELRAIYDGEREVFSYADRDYSVRYLGTMLGTQAPSLPDSACAGCRCCWCARVNTGSRSRSMVCWATVRSLSSRSAPS
jgi:chemosensory pili system protein ChpA (sensor histidine kinase/response regulator)